MQTLSRSSSPKPLRLQQRGLERIAVLDRKRGRVDGDRLHLNRPALGAAMLKTLGVMPP